MKKSELLLPAGNVEKLEIIFKYGADAAYLGGEMFSLRAFAGNFNKEELEKAVKYAHSLGKKIYVTLNVIPHNEEMDELPEYVRFLDTIKVDGVIVADLGVFQIVRENSSLNISVSTQASNTNWRSVKMWHSLGAKRVVLARELSLEEIKEIKEKVPEIELEMFIHGAMCISISGRCLLSNYMTGRDANRGSCAHPCRWKYNLTEEKRPGEYFPVEEDENGTYIFNSKDLCTIEFIDKILNLGIHSLKIEGRMKGMYYAAVCAKIYREALDSYYSGEYKYNPQWKEELLATSNRKYTNGFYEGKTNETSQNYESAAQIQSYSMVAKVIEDLGNDEYILEIRNRVEQNEEVEVLKPVGENKNILFPELEVVSNGERLPYGNPNMIVKIKCTEKLEKLDMFRKKL